MQPNMIDTMSDTQTPYALVKLEESARIIKQSMNELPLLRKRLDKYRENKPKAREVYGDMQQQHVRLLAALRAATLSLLEMDLSEIADYSVKLGQSIQAFNILTPDYSKLCAVLTAYLAKLPVVDPADLADTTYTTNAKIIGRLMANVKMGYYPTDMEHINHLARGISYALLFRRR